jgi:phosphate uptake regulator
MAESKALATKAKSKGGRPPGLAGVTQRNIRMVQKLYAEHAQEALDTYLEVMRNPDNDPAVRIRAAKDITDRAFGTPVSTQVVEKLISDDRESPINPQALTGAATRDLEQLAQTLARFIESERNTIEVNPEMPENYPRE